MIIAVSIEHSINDISKMANIKICVILLFACATYFIKESQAQRPEIAYLGRFLFRLGTSFIPRSCPPADPLAGEFPDYEEDVDATTEPNEPTVATEETTEEVTKEVNTEEAEEDEETTIEPEAR